MNRNRDSIIVTGGAGFIGCHLARRILEDRHNVIVVDNLSTGIMSNIPSEADFINIDLSDQASFTKLPWKGVKAVFHLAAQSSGEISHEKPEVDLIINSLSTLLLLKWCKEKNIQRFIYASSMAVYGEPEALPVTEECPCNPISFYGISKLTSENYIRCFSREQLATTTFRMFSVYGPGQDLNNLKQGIVSIYLSFLLREEPVLVKGSKDRFRDLIYIEDVANAWAEALDKEKTFGKVYNLATGKKTRIFELIEEEINVMGYDPASYPVIYQGSTPGDQFGMWADISRLKQDLNWSPKVQLSEGLRKMVKWIRLSAATKNVCHPHNPNC